jgi:hypothetical protein
VTIVCYVLACVGQNKWLHGSWSPAVVSCIPSTATGFLTGLPGLPPSWRALRHLSEHVLRSARLPSGNAVRQVAQRPAIDRHSKQCQG